MSSPLDRDREEPSDRPGADVHLARVAGDGCDVGDVEVGLGLVAVLVGVAQLAVDVAVGALRAQLKAGVRFDRHFGDVLIEPIL